MNRIGPANDDVAQLLKDQVKEEAERAKRAEAEKLVQLLAEQKAARDARYAARKERQKKGR